MLNYALEVKGGRLAEDACVLVARLGDFVRIGQEISERTGVEITLSGHGGDGNLHPSLFFEHGDLDGWHRAEAALEELLRAALDLGEPSPASTVWVCKSADSSSGSSVPPKSLGSGPSRPSSTRLGS